MTAPSPAPRFVEFGGDVTPPTPITFSDVEIWGFLLEGDYAKLAALTARFFETPSGGAIRLAPLSRFVMMSFTDIGRGMFDTAPQRGWASERELTFWIFGERQRRVDGAWRSEGVAAFSPYLFLDNPVAIATGREVVGYLKQQGWITLPADADPDADFAADVYGAAQAGPDVQWGRAPFARVGRPEGSGVARAWSGVAEALHDIVGMAGPEPDRPPGVGPRLADLPELLAGALPQLFLRQFRATERPELCAFQEIVLAPMTITRLHGGGLEASRPLRLERLASTPVIEELGLAPAAATGPGFRVRIDMRLEPGRTLWRAGSA